MEQDGFTRIANGLVKTAMMSADNLAAKKGEDDAWVKIKRNNERLNSCAGHDFEPDPNWRETRPFLNRTVHCRRCGGDMKVNDAHHYLLGIAHATGQDHKAMTAEIWPPAE